MLRLFLNGAFVPVFCEKYDLSGRETTFYQSYRERLL